MAAYYNEIEPYAAEWLRNLIKAGHIPNGEVDTRSIIDVAPDDLRGFTQCHFFAGIGGWGLALRLARWPDDRPIWTGSCPCQPFSVAGKGAGVDDPRHLWPHFHRLIAACRPPVVMGEQVAGAAGYGWLDGVRADLAREGYASRGVDIPACSVDAPHIRQRLYWVASDMAYDKNIAGVCIRDNRTDTTVVGGERVQRQFGRSDGDERLMADASDERRERNAGKLVEPKPLHEGKKPVVGGSSQETFDSRSTSFWSDHIWLTGADGKSRRSKPGLPLLAYGIPNRVGRLRAYGNAIVPQVAAEVIRAFAEAQEPA